MATYTCKQLGWLQRGFALAQRDDPMVYGINCLATGCTALLGSPLSTRNILYLSECAWTTFWTHSAQQSLHGWKAIYSAVAANKADWMA